MMLDEYLAGREESRRIFEALRAAVERVGPAEIRVTRSQIAFWRKRAFARAWVPDRYLHGWNAPLVLTLGYRRRDPSPRWKSIVEPAPGRFTHHLELWSEAEVDEEVGRWLREAWEAAG